MTDIYPLRNVFNRGMPTVTYVDRSHLALETALRGAVAKGHAIIAVTGPSKCGKTVLRKRVIPDSAAVRIEGGQVAHEIDFWDTIRGQLGEPTSRTEVTSDQQARSGSGGLNLGIAPMRANASIGGTSTKIEGETRNFSGAEKQRLLQRLIEESRILVVDDFHYIKRETRSNIVRALKGPVFDGLTVVMLSVPYHAFDVLAAEAEMEGRFTHLTIPKWDEGDLRKIGTQGFPLMGLELEDDIVAMLAKEALGSPLLMQSICAECCSQIGVYETAVPPQKLKHTLFDFFGVFISIARDFGLPAFQKLSTGPQSRTDRIPRNLLNGDVVDIYQAVLAAIAIAGAPESLRYDDLRSALRDVMADAVPQKHEITRTVDHMCSIAVSMQRNSSAQRGDDPADDARVDVPAIDWEAEVLYLNDVFLRFYLRWVHKNQVAAGM